MRKLYFFALFLVHVFGLANNMPSVLTLEASISGGATVCQNSGTVTLTLTGSGGTAPYTFVYTIDGTTQTPISTSGTNDSVTISAPTNVVSSFDCRLIKFIYNFPQLLLIIHKDFTG